MTINPFHLAMPVHDLEQARLFYGGVLGFEEGRSSEKWVDFNFYGHQFVAHLNPTKTSPVLKSLVDGENVPVPHYGVILDWQDWKTLETRLKQQEINFIIEPTIRFKDQFGEQATMFFADYSGNALEFKSFKNQQELFSKDGNYG